MPACTWIKYLWTKEYNTSCGRIITEKEQKAFIKNGRCGICGKPLKILNIETTDAKSA